MINDEKCHLCNKALGSSQKDIRSHVGKHLEEVALMALPKEDEGDSDGSSNSDREALNSHKSLVVEAPSPASIASGKCPYQDCGRHFKDLKAHVLTHQAQRPFKCSVVSCEKGFARRSDRNRHASTHYKGTMVCGLCPGLGTAVEKSFNRVDVFKRHLVSVHRVEQSRSEISTKSCLAPIERRSLDSPLGICSICSKMFSTAQESYEHLDDCVLRAACDA